MAESNLANNVITPWAYSLFGMFNPYAYSQPGQEKWGPQFGGQPPSYGGAPLPMNTLNGWTNGSSGGNSPGQGAPSGLSGAAVMPSGYTEGGGQSPSGGAPGTGPFMTQDWFNAYANTMFGGGGQAPQSPEEQMGRQAAFSRWAGANQDFDRAMGNSRGVGNGMLNASMGAFDQSGNFIGGQNSGLFGAAQQNLGQLGNGGAWGAYNNPTSWANSLQPYAQASSAYVAPASSWANGLEPYAQAASAYVAPASSWANGLEPYAQWGVQAVDQSGKSAMGSQSGWTDNAPAAAQQALGGIGGDYRGHMASAGSVGSGALGNINPLLAGREAQTGAMWDQTSGGGFDLAQRRDAMGYDPNAMAQRGVSDTAALNNEYTKKLMEGIDAETKATLGAQTPEVAAAMAAAGYGESGAGQGAMGSLVSSIMGQANRDKQRVLSDLTESNLARQAAAIGQRTSVGSQAASDVLNTASQTYNQASAQREQARNLGLQLGAGTAADAYLQQQGALNNMEGSIYGANANNIGALQQGQWNARSGLNSDIFGAQSNMANSILGMSGNLLGQGLQANADFGNNLLNASANLYGQGMQANANFGNNLLNTSANLLGQGLGAYTDRGNMIAQLGQQGLFGAEDAMQRRAGMNSDINNSGFNMLSNLFGMQNQNYNDRMNASIGLGRNYQDYQQGGRNQILDLLLMPYRTGLQVTTGINTSPVPNNYRPNPYVNAGLQMGGNIVSGMFGNGQQGSGVNPYEY